MLQNPLTNVLALGVSVGKQRWGGNKGWVRGWVVYHEKVGNGALSGCIEWVY